MQRQWIESSALASVGYDRLGGVLEVEFASGGVYRHFGVSVTEVEGLMTAGSHGAYFGREIWNRYCGRRVVQGAP